MTLLLVEGIWTPLLNDTKLNDTLHCVQYNKLKLARHFHVYGGYHMHRPHSYFLSTELTMCIINLLDYIPGYKLVSAIVLICTCHLWARQRCCSLLEWCGHRTAGCMFSCIGNPHAHLYLVSFCCILW